MVLDIFDRFWTRHPALFYALAALLGFYSGSDTSLIPSLLLPTLLLLATSSDAWKRALERSALAAALMGAMFFYASACYRMPELPPEGAAGSAHFAIDSLTSAQTHFGSQWVYQGKAVLFSPSSGKSLQMGKNVPITVRIPKSSKQPRPTADRDYVLRGTLQKGATGRYYFVCAKGQVWEPIPESFSLAEKRHAWKSVVKNFIYKRIRTARAAEFLSGIVTGDFEDRIMRAEFGRAGLQHIMAISGFHFAVVAGILGFLFRWFLPAKASVAILALLLSGYLLFLGGTPSIARAWAMSTVLLLGVLLERRSFALNALGVATLLILAVDPMLTKTVGFRLSAITTACILVFYPTGKLLFNQVIPLRSLSTMSKVPLFDQHCYCLLAGFKEALALSFAVNIAAIPLTLYYFNKFPLLGFVYNLFIPFLVGICMFFFLVGTLLWLVLPPAGAAVFWATEHSTRFMLNFLYNAPSSLNSYWVAAPFPDWYIATYLTVLFFAGIVTLDEVGKEKSIERDIFV